MRSAGYARRCTNDIQHPRVYTGKTHPLRIRSGATLSAILRAYRLFFFELPPSMGTGFVAELDGEIFGCSICAGRIFASARGETKSLRISMPFPLMKVRRGAASAPSFTRHACETHGTTGRYLLHACRQRIRFMIWYESRCGLAAASYCRYEGRLWPLPKLTALLASVRRRIRLFA